jgi:peptidoglycan lytic transglycosylase
MGHSGAYGHCVRLARFLALGAGALALANCAGGPGRIDPRYGVAASERVVQPGQPVPKGGGVYRVGKPYVVAGHTYYPSNDPHYTAVGLASWYGDDFHGRYTANGEVFDENAISAASPTLPLPSYARVTNLRNHRSIVVRVNDRGPYVGNRVIDLSIKTAKLLGFYDSGLARVKVEYVGRAPLAGSDDRMLMATLRQGEPTEGKPVLVASNRDYAPTEFASRPRTDIPTPPDRPFRLGEGARDVPPPEPAVARRAPTTELAATARPQPVEIDAPPVSAYAPMRYDAHAAGFMSGRGLY